MPDDGGVPLESLGMRDLISAAADRFATSRRSSRSSDRAPCRGPTSSSRASNRAGDARYLHPRLETILKRRYGVILYQEQVCKSRRSSTATALGGADCCDARWARRNRGDGRAAQRVPEGCDGRGVRCGGANHIFDQMETFAGYGFNKSHAAAYARSRTRPHGQGAPSRGVHGRRVDADGQHGSARGVERRAKRMAIVLEPPDVNASVLPFTVPGPKRIATAGRAEGVGRAPSKRYVRRARRSGRFTGLVDLCRRVDLTKINRRVLEALRSRARSTRSARIAHAHATASRRTASGGKVGARAGRGQTALFGSDEREVALEPA